MFRASDTEGATQNPPVWCWGKGTSTGKGRGRVCGGGEVRVASAIHDEEVEGPSSDLSLEKHCIYTYLHLIGDVTPRQKRGSYADRSTRAHHRSLILGTGEPYHNLPQLVWCAQKCLGGVLTSAQHDRHSCCSRIFSPTPAVGHTHSYGGGTKKVEHAR